MPSARDREEMVARLYVRGVTDPRVLDAMRAVPRELFVPAEAAEWAYQDGPLGIGLGQTISAPWIVAYCVAALGLGPDAHVLEVGTGSGYGAAVLSRCARSVVTVERHAELADRARGALAEAGCDNVEVRVGDGAYGAPDRAPFDGIVVTAMAPDEPPPRLVDQLRPGAALICPVGRAERGVLVRHRDGRTEDLADVAFVPLVSEPP